MKSLPFILGAAAILAAALSAVLYFTTQGKLREMDDLLRAATGRASAAEAELDLYSGQLEAIEKELVTERINTAESKRSEERLRAEIYTARREVSISNQELANAREKIEELESSGRRLRQNLVEIEQIFAKPDTKPEIDKLNARIFQLEEANLQLKKELHAAGQRKSSPRAYTIEAENRTSIESILTKDRLIIIRAKLENRFKEGEKITLLRSGEVLAHVQILRISSGLAVANLLPGSKISQLSAGTEVDIAR